MLRSALLVAILVTGYFVMPLRGERWWVGALVGTLAIVGTMPVTVRRVRAVRQAEQPVLVAIEAIVLLVSMLVLGFSAIYYAIDVEPGQFEDLATRVDAVYFTVTTMATVGYGDVHAVGQASRAIVTVQMLANLTFVGIVVRVMARAAGTR
jgi:hypothetical protein